MTVECDVAVEHLVAYSEGSLRGARLEVVEAHVQACPVCRSRLTDFQHADRMLRAQQVHDDVSARRALTSS
jgi:predicted anti-sigma-YlaC factor YlaD